MLYKLMFSEWEIQRLTLVLEAVRDMRIIRPQEAERMLEYIHDEVEVQNRVLRLAEEGKDIFESMKIKIVAEK
jgi:predicted type IV restriction endonuclease